MSVRKQLGQILLEAKVLDEYQLKSALGYQKRWGGRLGRVLVDNHFITEQALVEAIHKQTGVDMVDLKTIEVPDYLIRLVPPELATRHMLVPVRLEGEAGKSSETLFLAMADPTNLEALDEIRFRTGKRTRPLLAAESEIEKAIRRIYLKQSTQTPVERESAQEQEVEEIIQGQLEQPVATPVAKIIGETELDLADPFAALDSGKAAAPAAGELPEIELVDELDIEQPALDAQMPTLSAPPPGPPATKPPASAVPPPVPHQPPPAGPRPVPPPPRPTVSPMAPAPVKAVSSPVAPAPIRTVPQPMAPPSKPFSPPPVTPTRQPTEEAPDSPAPAAAAAPSSPPPAEEGAEGRQLGQVVSEVESRLGQLLDRLASAENGEQLPALMKPSHIVAALIRLLLQKKVFSIEELLKELENQ